MNAQSKYLTAASAARLQVGADRLLVVTITAARRSEFTALTTRMVAIAVDAMVSEYNALADYLASERPELCRAELQLLMLRERAAAVNAAVQAVSDSWAVTLRPGVEMLAGGGQVSLPL